MRSTSRGRSILQRRWLESCRDDSNGSSGRVPRWRNAKRSPLDRHLHLRPCRNVRPRRNRRDPKGGANGFLMIDRQSHPRGPRKHPRRPTRRPPHHRMYRHPPGQVCRRHPRLRRLRLHLHRRRNRCRKPANQALRGRNPPRRDGQRPPDRRRPQRPTTSRSVVWSPPTRALLKPRTSPSSAV